MKSLYLLVLVSFCQGLPRKKVAQLSAPTMIRVAVLDPPAFEVSWNKVENDDDKNPIIGYKVKVWEIKKTTSTQYAYVDGKITKLETEKEKPIDLIPGSNGSELPVEVLSSSEETIATYYNVKPDITYEIRVQAYTENYEGPMSGPIRIKLDKD